MTQQIEHGELSREGITSLDQALYVASVFAASSPEKCVTIQGCILGNHEVYRVVDGRPGSQRDNASGVDWTAHYVIERV